MERYMGVNLLYSILLLLLAVCPAYAAALAEGDNANTVEENDSTPAGVGQSCSTNAAKTPLLDFSYTCMAAA
jgi:hypothetical protein